MECAEKILYVACATIVVLSVALAYVWNELHAALGRERHMRDRNRDLFSKRMCARCGISPVSKATPTIHPFSE